jgi:hypothetical protein
MNLRTSRIFPLLLLCAFMTGCGKAREALMPVSDKINAAHPLPADVRTTQTMLTELLASDERSMRELEGQLKRQLDLRALACSKQVAIGRFSTVEDVKKLALNSRCFQDQDQELQTFLGIRTIGLLLAADALRPYKPAGPMSALPKLGSAYLSSGVFARDAGVGVLVDTVGEAAIVNMPGGQIIAKLPREVARGPGSHLSPNGRVFVHRSQDGLVFYATETGGRVGTLPSSSALLAWLPEVGSLVYSTRDGGVMLADGLLGAIAPHPLATKYSAYGAHIPGGAAKMLVGTSNAWQLFEHTRSAAGVKPTMVKQYTLSGNAGISSGHMVPMREGKLVVFKTMLGTGWLDLDTGQSGNWGSSSMTSGLQHSKLDESRLLLDMRDGSGMGLKPWLLDVTTQTVAPVEFTEGRGTFVDIGDRVGFMRRGEVAFFGDSVKTGQAEPLDKVVANVETEIQIAKLRAQTELLNRTGSAPGQATSGLAFDATPRALAPGLADVPKDAQVHIIGVYEGKQPTGVPRNAQNKPIVRVIVRNANKPVVLVLASYEAVSWQVTNVGARVSAVLLSGYTPSTVSGTGGATQLRIGNNYAYSPTSSEYLQLRRAVTQYTGPLEIRSFQGAYAGSDFSVGGH